jgi:hypothetical protein
MHTSHFDYHSLGGLFYALAPERALLFVAVVVVGILAAVVVGALLLHRAVSAAIVRGFVRKLSSDEADEVRLSLTALQGLLWCGVFVCIIAGSDASVHDRWVSVLLTLLAYACFSGARIAKDCQKHVAFR